MKIAIKRKKRGMALIFTLFVVVIALTIASSYLGMTISSQKAARSNAQEAAAISLTQLGLEAMLNAVGQNENWSRQSGVLCDVFSPKSGDTIYLYLLNKNITTGASQSTIPGVSPTVSPTTSVTNRVTMQKGPSNYTFWFGEEFLGIGSSNYPTGPNGNVIMPYVTTNPIDVPNGTEKRKGHIMAVVMPENDPTSDNFAKQVNGVWMTRDNRNYVIAVTSFIFKNGDSGVVSKSDWTNNYASIVDRIEASRTAKIRMSFVFPGSQIQNTVSADYPNTNNSTEGEFSYPNYEEYTANAAFIDENCEWDGALRIDGPSKDTGYGAPKSRASSSTTLANHTQKISDYHNQAGSNRDTSGVLRISTLDASYTNYQQLNAAATKQIDNKNNGNGEKNLLPTFSKSLSAQKGVTYVDIKTDDGSGSSEQIISKGTTSWQDAIFTAKTNAYEQDTATNSIDSVWNSGNNSLLSSFDESTGTQKVGLFNQMNQGKKGYIDCYSSYKSSYKPDAMYANESMEVPTIRITITPEQSNGSYVRDSYKIDKVSYNYNGNTWVEVIDSSNTITSDDIKDTGMIYVAGGNVQVQGRASQSVSIVSDRSPKMEADNANGTGIFDNNLNFPNALISGSTQYRYADPQISADGTQWTTNTSINTKGDKAIFQKTNPASEGGWRFPTYDPVDEQPTGNISIIGDIVKAEGTTPAIGLIASNRVLLNDFSHTASNATKSDAVNKNAAITSTQNSRKGNSGTDGVLSVDALIASENHNMCFDFNNLSKNTNYINNSASKSSDFSSYLSKNGNLTYAPGDTTPLTASDAYTQSKTNYGMIMDEALAKQLGINNNSNNLIADDGKGTKTFFYSKFDAMSPGSKLQAWSDAYRGALRTDNAKVGAKYFSNGAFNFNGLIIERFGDINADAGERATDGTRINQLGYKNQFINFDSNLLDSSCPFFSPGNQSLQNYGSCIKWTVLSYIDKGSPSWLNSSN